MITVATIPWERMGTLPESRKDGRELLLAIHHPEYRRDTFPFLYFVASWNEDKKVWSTTESTADGELRHLTAAEPKFWAEINPPV